MKLGVLRRDRGEGEQRRIQTRQVLLPLSRSEALCAERVGEGVGGVRGFPMKERLFIPPDLHKRMVEIARVLRKEHTRSEAILWQALRNRTLEGRKFRRQQPLGAFVLDFYCAEERLAVEVDGRIHESQQQADQLRQALIETLGIRFVRVTAEQVESDLAGALQAIQAAFTR